MISRAEIKRLRSLHQKKYRKKYSQFLMEGVRLVEEAASRHAGIAKIWHLPDFGTSPRRRRLIEQLDKHAIPRETATVEELRRISDTVHDQGIIGIVRLSEPDREAGSKDNWLYLDEIRDPGNLGTILRTAVWFDIKQIGLSTKCVDAYNPKVVRAGMGAHFHLNIFPDIDLRDIRSMGHTILASDPNGKPVHQIPRISNKFCLVLGSEAHGLSERTKALADCFLAAPGTGETESLNVAVAAGILIYVLTTKAKGS